MADRCVRPRCRREPAVKYSCPGTPDGWRGWLCRHHRNIMIKREERRRMIRYRPQRWARYFIYRWSRLRLVPA